MAFVVNCEDKPLRKQRLGPPDVYPQDPKQKEDELTAVSVKQGFNASPVTSDEYGSAKSLNISPSKMVENFSAILSKKYEINTLPETGKKKQQISHRDNYWPVPTRPKAAELWLKDLVGNKPLTVLAKKVPIFNKKDEILSKLCDYCVPTVRACWLIKMSSAYYVAISETKNKSKRQLPDQTQEWTQTLQRFLKEQLNRLEEHYSWTPQPSAFPTMSGGSSEEQKVTARQWQYGTQLAGVMYEEGLLDRELFLEWVLDVFRARPHDCGLLKLIVPLLLQYVGEFTRSELLARKLAYYVCKKINQMVAEMDASGGRSQSPVFGQNGAEAPPPPAPPIHSNPLVAAFIRLVNCNFYESIIYGLSSVLQMILYKNPTALVWNNLGDGKTAPLSSSPLGGSPLDLLPCLPSCLPLPPSASNAAWRARLRRVEDDVLDRSRASDTRWSVQTSTETTVGRVLTALDALDQHKWNRADDTNNFDTLYARIFPPSSRGGGGDSTTETAPSDDAIVQLLCEWAVSPQRLGEHRAPAVAMLLEKRQSELTSASDGDGDDRDSVCSGSYPAYIYQALLFRFLDTSAPVLDAVGLGGRSRAPFASLVLLFLELTRHDVFSHDQYLRTLISRGELRTNPASAAQSAAAFGRSEQPADDDDKLDIDDDLDKLVKHIKSTNADMDNPDSPKEGFSSLGTGHAEKLESRRQNRHLIYTTHFPLPQEDAYTDDDKQRHILLFGVKKARDEARHTVKKMNKEIMKLFSKKLSVDVSEGGKVKRQSRGEFPFEAVVHRFQALSFYDQHHVTHQCATQVVEMLSAFAAGSSNYLPVVEHVSFLFDLMELAMNIRDLLDCCVQMLRELPDVEGQLHSKNSSRAGTFATSLALHIVGACRRFHSTLILSQDQTAAIFEGLCKVVKHVRNHTDCSSAERCILAHLVNLYSSCSFLKSKHYEARFESFSNAYSKLKQLFNTSLKQSGSSFSRNAAFMAEYIANPTRPIESSTVRALNESGANRYSFVCNVLIEVCNTTDSERLSDLAVLAAEATARCNALSPEWLGVLEGICGALETWMDVLAAIDRTAQATHRSVALFMTVLAARHCIYMDDVIQLGAQIVACRKGDGEREPGARLVLRLLGHLWIPSEQPQPTWYGTGTSTSVPSAGQPCSLKYSCDRHLLLAAQDNILVPALLCALKAIIMLADATIGDGAAGRPENKAPGELSISAILGTSDHHGEHDEQGRSGAGLSKAGLSEFARHMLKQICSQPWVREKFLSSPEEIVSMEKANAPDSDDDADLLERVLSFKQARRLFHMIVHPENYAFYTDDQSERQVCGRILETLDQWTMRVALLDLRLLYRQTAKQAVDKHTQWLNTLAQATIEAFQQGAGDAYRPAASPGSEERPSFVWLIPPLVAKLPVEAQGRILLAAIQVLESAGWTRKAGQQGGGVPAGPGPASHQPFKQLVLACVRGQEEQRDDLVSSLQVQFQQFLSKDSKDETKDKEEKRKESNKRETVWPDEHKTGPHVYAALQLRFSLLGGVFDAIQRGSLSSSDTWVLLLAQLVTNGVVTLYNNSDMYTTVVDMISTLIHSAVVGDSQSEKPEENKRHYQTLAKKLRKELGDRRGVSIKYLRQFLPIPKKTVEVINCELKSAPLPGFESFEKRRGLILVDKQKVSPWDLLEGHRNPAPLSWSWFGALKLERTISKYEEVFKMMRFHRHSGLVKQAGYYLEAPPVPPEDIEPAPEKQKEETKAVEVPSCDSPRGAKRPRGGGQRKKRERPNRSLSNSGIMAPRMNTPPMTGMGPYTSGGMYGQEAQWGFPQQPGPQQAAPYYQQQAMAPGGGQRYQTASKQAITQMLRNRQPGAFLSQSQPQPGYPGMHMQDKQLQMRQQQMLSGHVYPDRDQIRVQHGAPSQLYPPRQMQGPPAPGPGMPQSMYPGMNQSYNPAYMGQQAPQPTQMMNQANPNPLAFSGQQPGVPSGAPQQQGMMQQQQQPGMIPMRAQQQPGPAGYMPQIRPTANYMQAPNVTVNTMAGGQYRGMASGPPAAGLQQRMRHPMMMQQQPTLMNQLRQPSLVQQQQQQQQQQVQVQQQAQQQQQQPQQHNPYQFHHP